MSPEEKPLGTFGPHTPAEMAGRVEAGGLAYWFIYLRKP
jgi:hypothetical protein